MRMLTPLDDSHLTGDGAHHLHANCWLGLPQLSPPVPSSPRHVLFCGGQGGDGENMLYGEYTMLWLALRIYK